MIYFTLGLLVVSLGAFFYVLKILNTYRKDTDEAFKKVLAESKRAQDAELAKNILEANVRELQYALVEETRNVKKSEEALKITLKNLSDLNEMVTKFAKGDSNAGDLINLWLSKLPKGNDPSSSNNNGN